MKVLGFLIGFLLSTSLAFCQDPSLNGWQVGDQAPLFTAKDYLGEPVDLAQKLKEGPVVLMFYRGVWCPYCNRQLQEMQDSLSFIQDRGGSVIAITPETVENIESTADKTEATFQIIHDQDLKIMNDYRVTYQLDQATVDRYLRNGINIEVNNGANGANLPVPATYIIDQAGKIIFAFFDPDYTKRATIQKILQYL